MNATLTTPTTSPAPALTWLAEEFPDWRFEVRTTVIKGQRVPLYVASRPGDHAQSELTPAKLHTRLSDYLRREAMRHSFGR